MTNRQIRIGQHVKVNATGLSSDGKRGTVLSPCFHADESIDSFIGWKVSINGEVWVFNCEQLEEV